jgi:hypothetical protein
MGVGAGRMGVGAASAARPPREGLPLVGLLKSDAERQHPAYGNKFPRSVRIGTTGDSGKHFFGVFAGIEVADGLGALTGDVAKERPEIRLI